jgi:L-alanine-DL-glutamate epimerase and related enzymes of enolase superfamily
MKVAYRSYDLPFRHPFTISRGTKTHQPTFIVELEHFGIKGYGEAPAISYYNIPVEKMISQLEFKRSMLEKFSFTDPERFWHYLHHLFPGNSFLVCALDMAGWDLFGKMNRKKLSELWGLGIKNPVTDFTIGIDTIESMVKKMIEFPWPIYKIKLGTGDDVAVITELRKHTSSIIRVDANAAWEAGEALEKINIFKNLQVELVEQPLAKENLEGMKYLYDRSPLPLIADESCIAENDVEKCHLHFHGINIKLTKCGGITPARRMIERARELDMKVMLGSMNETTIGTAAIVQLSPGADFLDADGPLLLAEDIASGLTYVDGKPSCSDRPGLGIHFMGSFPTSPE